MITVHTKITRNRNRELTPAGRRAAARRNEDLAKLTVEIATQLVPVSDNNEPGHIHLRDTIRVEKNPRTGSASAVAGDESKDVFHAIPVELGTVHMAAQPYLRPAADLATKRSRNRRVTLLKG